MLGPRMEMARRYILENGLNRIVVDVSPPVAGHRRRRARLRAGPGGARHPRSRREALAEMGVRVLRLGALNPFDGDAVRRVAAGTTTPSSSRTRRRTSRPWCGDALYGRADQPVVLGKAGRRRAALIPLNGALTAENLVEPLRRCSRWPSRPTGWPRLTWCARL